METVDYSCIEEKNLSSIQKSMMPTEGGGLSLPEESTSLGKEIDLDQELRNLLAG